VTDIAQLGLAVDSSQVRTATTALGQLTAAAGPASLAASQLKVATSGNAVAQGQSATAADKHSESLRGQRLVLRAIASDAAVFGGALGQVAAVAGTTYIENAHLFEGFGGLKSAIGGMLTPTNLFVGALAAVAVGGVLALDSIVKQQQAYADLSEHVNVAVGALRGLGDSANTKGINQDDFVASMQKFGDLSAQAKSNMGALVPLFSANRQLAGSMVDDLANVADDVARAGNAQLAYKIIAEAGLPTTKAWLNYLSQGGAAMRAAAAAQSPLNAAEQVLADKAKDLDEKFNAVWEHVANAGKSAIVTVAGSIDDLVNSSAWKLLHAPLELGKYVAGLISPPKPTSAADQVSGAFDSLNPDYKNSALARGLYAKANPGKTTVLDDELRKHLEDAQQQIAILGDRTTPEDAVKQKQNELALAHLSNPHLNVSGTDAQALIKQAHDQALGTSQIDDQVTALKTQTAAIGMGTGALAAYSAEQDKLNYFTDRGITLSKADAAQLHASAQALGEATQASAVKRLQNSTNFETSQLGRSDSEASVATAMNSIYGDQYLAHMNDDVAAQIRLNTALKDMKSTATSAMTTFLNDLKDGKKGADALKDALGGIESKLLDMVSNNVMSSLFGSVGKAAGDAGGGGLFGSFMSMFGFGGSSAGAGAGGSAAVQHGGYGPGDPIIYRHGMHSSVFAGAPRYHAGVGPGERAAVIRTDESVLTPGQMKALAPVARPGGGQNTQVNVNNYSGADVQQQKRSENGVDIVDIMIGQVGKHMARGDLDSALAARPGGRQPLPRR